ncbi:DUF814 domain-containing protein [Candidatus Woesearchaeota archaeon]|nr:DUF814 domain-containing protein [Candidatus Woesearchaeota archaeon]
MRITLELNKSVEQNAAIYFEKAKKAKKKLEGAKIALGHSESKLRKLREKQELEIEKMKQEAEKKPRKIEWYEKFRWFISSNNFLIIAGRDATTNEIVIKKHTEKNDLVFHTSMAGSPFAVIKSENKKIDDTTVKETADFVAAYSRAWKTGLTTLDVFYVDPEQVSKQAPSGEYIQKGSFMIYGKKNELNGDVKLFIGSLEDSKIMAGPESAVKKHCRKCLQVFQGKEKTSAIAKKIKAKLGGDLDEIIRLLPAGGCKL